MESNKYALIRKEAEKLLSEAESCNPGAWVNHSRVAAHCAEKIAKMCDGMDSEKAYIMGLMHDIGRKFGVRHLGHVSDGYSYMMSLKYDEAARVCLTHSFNTQSIDDYIGKFDISQAEYELINVELAKITMNDYDRLIQLCDCLAGIHGVLDIIERMEDVKRRYGSYPPKKWEQNIKLKEYFEAKTGRSIYDITEKERYHV